LLQGRDEFLAAMRAAVRNGAVPDTYANQYARFAAREYALVLVSSSYYNTAQKQGLPARFAPLDFLQAGTHHVSVARKAAHPNAARLLAAFLAGPEGQRIAEGDFGAGNIYYETSSEYKLAEEARAAGVPTFFWIERPDALEYPMTPHGEETLREVELILKGG
jgi:ABC-type Fe3+ transport system substrate-binding protein